MIARAEARSQAASTARCVEFLDRILSPGGLLAATKGMYDGDASLSYEVAQQNQIDWLLDQVGCTPGMRILEIGCGNGDLLAAAWERGAEPVGISNSPRQVNRCRGRGLDVELLDYRALPRDWDGRFDAIVATGSIEHFVQPQNVLAGQDDAIYRNMFDIFARLLDPNAESALVATSVIHRRDESPRIDPADLLSPPWMLPWRSPEFHSAILQQSLGGCCPLVGQLEGCAGEGFRLVREIDGTDDHCLSLQACFARVAENLRSRELAESAWPLWLDFARRHPRQVSMLMVGLFVTESWQWQFHGDPATQLLRHVWQLRV